MRVSYAADTAGFEELQESTLLIILKLEVLDMSETDLFAAVKGWASRRCTKNNVELTGPNLRQVSFEKKSLLYLKNGLKISFIFCIGAGESNYPYPLFGDDA